MMAAAASDGLHPLRRRRSLEWLPPDMSELRVVLLGNSWSLRSSVGNFILETTKFKSDEDAKWCQRENGQIKEKKVVVINTPDQMLDPDISEVNLIEIIENCKGLCDPGPHVFLLVLQPEDFTEEDNLRLCRVLESFSDQSFKHSLILLSASREESPRFRERPPLKDLIRKCGYRYLWQKNLELSELLTRFGQIVKENNGEHVSYERYSDPVSSSAADQRSPEQKETQTSIIEEKQLGIMKEKINKEQEERKKEEQVREEMNRRREREEELEEMRRRTEEQREDIEKERKLREKQLEEMKENIKREQEERKKEEQAREEINRKRKQEEERKRQEWKQRLETIEQRIKSESESKMHINKELQKTRDEMEKEKENWEKEQQELEEQRTREDEQRKGQEQKKLRQLQEEYEQKREEDEKKREEEDRMRKEEEEKRLKELQQKYEMTLEALKKKYEEEARKQAEEFNEFREKHYKVFAAEREKHEKELKDKDEQYDILKALSVHKEQELRRTHQNEICTLVKHVTRNKRSLSKIQELLNKYEKQMMEKEKKGMNEEEKKCLQEKHEEELIKEIPEILKQVDASWCSIQ